MGRQECCMCRHYIVAALIPYFRTEEPHTREREHGTRHRDSARTSRGRPRRPRGTLTHPRVLHAHFRPQRDPALILAHQKSAKGNAELEQDAELLDAEAALAAATSA